MKKIIFIFRVTLVIGTFMMFGKFTNAVVNVLAERKFLRMAARYDAQEQFCVWCGAKTRDHHPEVKSH